jgi:GNAT superfamily N-acetyltransferase
MNEAESGFDHPYEPDFAPAPGYDPEYDDLRIENASEVPWADVEHALMHGGNGSACWCQWAVNEHYRSLDRDHKHDALHQELRTATFPPALVAFLGHEAVGWCRVGPRPYQSRLAGMRVVRHGSEEPLDDHTVWAVTCFVVRREHRGKGVAKSLLYRAIDVAREHGGRVIEGYPVDLIERPETPPNELFIGTLGLFESAGFLVGSRPMPGRVVVRLGL